MTRLKLLAAVVIVQILFFAGWAVREQMRLLPGVGSTILVRTAPVDPRDLLSGQYINLRYEFSRFSSPFDPGLKEGGAVWVVLREKEGFFVPRAFFASRPSALAPGEVVIAGNVGRWGNYDFGIERYFVPEGTPTPSARDLTIRLRIGDDYAPRIEQVLLKGQPWPASDASPSRMPHP